MRQSAPRLCRVAGRDAWHIRFEGRRISTGCTSRAEAEAFLINFIRDQSLPETISISGILTSYLADRRDAQKPGADRIGYAHMPLRRFWGERPPEAITDAETRQYQRARAAEKIANTTIRTELQALRAAMNWAVAKKIINEAPPITLPGRSAPRARWLTRDEADRLLEACVAPHVRLFILIALHTASRRTAILTLTWDRVDMEAKRIDFRDPAQQVTRKRRSQVPINDTLFAALLEARERATTQWVIEWAGGPVVSTRHAIDRAAERAKIEGVTPHVFRHTAATWMAQAGVPLWDIAGMLGNTMQMIDDTYGHHSPSHLSRAASALG